MDEFYRLAYQYYEHFYSYRKYAWALRWWIAWTMVFGMMFVVGSAIFLGATLGGQDEIDQSMKNQFYIVGLLELPFFYFLQKLGEKRIELIVGRATRRQTHLDLVTAQKKWINKQAGINESAYFDLVRDFNEMRRIYSASRGYMDFNIRDVLRSIYDPESKARVTSYLILAFSICGLIFMRGMDSPELFFESIASLTFELGTLLILFYALLLFVILFGLVYCMKFVITLLSIWRVSVDKERAKSNRVTSFLVRDLIRFSKLTQGNILEHDIRQNRYF